MSANTNPATLVAEIEAELPVIGISVGDFCRKAEIDRATWQRWKSGKTVPRQSMVSRVRRRLAELIRQQEVILPQDFARAGNAREAA